MTRWTGLAAAALVAAIVIPGTAARAAGDVRKGLAYAEKICAECHAVKAGVMRSPKAGATPFDTVMRVPGMTPLALMVFFQSPHPTMPNLIVEAQDREDLIAYMLSLKPATP